VTQNNAANAEETAAAAEELNSQSIVMHESVSDLLKLITGRQDSTPSVRNAVSNTPTGSIVPAKGGKSARNNTPALAGVT
jgi:methyl-accepting chemotaxis protein